MGADLSRVRFDALRDHSGVVLQQGRLLLDADWNELVAILDRRLRAAAADLGGTGGKPGVAGAAVVPRTTPRGFAIEVTGGSLAIGVGRMYVDGLLAENHGQPADAFDPLLAEPVGRRKVPYEGQPYWKAPARLPASGSHLVYLDVWEREVTPLQAPDLVEPAVGVDTTVRTQTAWRVRVHGPDTPGVTCATPDKDIPGWLDVIASSAGRLTTGTAAVDGRDDPCGPVPGAGYRGPENQTYRVEVHAGGAPGTATFKWSRDNGSVASPIVEVISATRLRPASLGRDGVLRFHTGDWVEILDDDRELNHVAGEMRKVEVHEEDATISWTDPLPADLRMSSADAVERHLRVRRWDQSGRVLSATGATVADLDVPDASGLIPITGTAPVILEHGITVDLDAPGGEFHTGDYWVFTARVATGEAERLVAAPPRGIHHHYARLAVATFPGTAVDCRTLWPPACGDCTVRVTPESHASGVGTVQAAVDAVARTGGTVCLAAGVYHLGGDGVRIEGAASVTLRGQGGASLLLARGSAVRVQRCAGVRLEDLSIVCAGEEPAVRLGTTLEASASRLTVLVAAPQNSQAPAFELSGASLLTRLRGNTIVAPVGVAGGGSSREAGNVGLLTSALEITGNTLVCPVSGISFEGPVAHLIGNAVRDNTILGCAGAAVRSTGLVGAGSHLDVSGNDVLVDGSGVQVATGCCTISRNRITGTGRSGRRLDDGIRIAPGSFGPARGSIRITGNQLSDISGTGTAVRGPVGDLDVSDNLISRTAHGIVMDQRARAGTVTVSGNVIRDVGGRDSDDATEFAAIQVVGACGVSVTGNTVDGVATAAGTAATGTVGIRILGCDRVHATGNSVERVGRAGVAGSGAGIQVTGFFDTALIQGNRCRRAGADVDDPPLSPWVGLEVLVRAEKGSPATVHLGGYVLVFGSSGYVFGDKTGYASGASALASATVDTNVLTGGGEAPAALVWVPGELIMTGNQCRQALQAEVPAVKVQARAAAINANRVRGGRPSIALQVPPGRFAVLGNITSTGIDVPGGLDPVWVPLNPSGVL